IYLFALSEHLKKAVRYYRPEARFSRNLYSDTLLDPRSEEWYAQNYQKRGLLQYFWSTQLELDDGNQCSLILCAWWLFQ
ncbi:MAG: putative glycosyl hydrolase family 13, partial [Bacteroidota bacterium]